MEAAIFAQNVSRRCLCLLKPHKVVIFVTYSPTLLFNHAILIFCKPHLYVKLLARMRLHVEMSHLLGAFLTVIPRNCSYGQNYNQRGLFWDHRIPIFPYIYFDTFRHTESKHIFKFGKKLCTTPE